MSAAVTPSPPGTSPIPTIPPSVLSCTTFRKKYGPWQPLAASKGGSGRAIGVIFRSRIFKGSGDDVPSRARKGSAPPPVISPPRVKPSHSRRWILIRHLLRGPYTRGGRSASDQCRNRQLLPLGPVGIEEEVA